MTAEQSLVGAMGCASWRAHYRLREYAALASSGRVIRGDVSLRVEDAEIDDLNEVGITDGVLAAIWRFGPSAAAYAISSRAEANHLGADIAIVQLSASRILLYQAKLARLRGEAYRLKSQVTKGQLKLLRRRRPIEILGFRFQVTGRLALYQQDVTPYLRNAPVFFPDMWWRLWPDVPGPLPAGIRGELKPVSTTRPCSPPAPTRRVESLQPSSLRGPKRSPRLQPPAPGPGNLTPTSGCGGLQHMATAMKLMSTRNSAGPRRSLTSTCQRYPSPSRSPR